MLSGGSDVSEAIDCCVYFKRELGCLDTCQFLAEGQFLTTTSALCSSTCRSLLKRSRRAKSVKDSSVPWPLLDTVGRGRSGFINADLLD